MIKWSKTPSPPAMPIQITFNGADVNVSKIRDALTQLYGDHPVVRKVLRIVRGGTIPWLAGGMAAVDWSDPKMMDHFHVTCDLVDGRIMVPNDLLDLEDVNGRVSIAKGRLSAHRVSARLGNTSAKKGASTMWDLPDFLQTCSLFFRSTNIYQESCPTLVKTILFITVSTPR
jgi:hypothetical protein